jgi:3-hydroxyisobutyrate dehydrogenase
MAQRLLAAGHELVVASRSPGPVEELVEAGAESADSPAEAARDVDAVITMLPDSPQVREVLSGADGVFATAAPETLVIEMSTISPAVARDLAAAGHARGLRVLDAPVSGGDVGAREARLSIMIGGEKEVVEALRPLFEIMGKTIVHQGPAGAGQHTKMVNQVLIATNMIGVCEALLYGYKAGLDLDVVLQSVGSGAAGSWSLNNLGPRMIAGNFEPGFFVEHFIKDMAIALAEAERMNLALPGLALAKQLYEAVRAQGYGRKGTHALMLGLERLSTAPQS